MRTNAICVNPPHARACVHTKVHIQGERVNECIVVKMEYHLRWQVEVHATGPEEMGQSTINAQATACTYTVDP